MHIRIVLSSLAALLTLLVATSRQAQAVDFAVHIGQIKDTRSTEAFYCELTIELKIFGDEIDKAVGVRCSVTKATDDTGKDLLKAEKKSEAFHDMKYGSPSVSMKNPARRASALKEVTGVAEVVVPANDPDATITVADFATKPRVVVSHPSLAANGAAITVLSKAEYEKEQKEAEQKEKEKRKPKAGRQDLGESMANAMTQAFAGMFGGMGGVGENAVILMIKDPNSKVVKTEFRDKSGAELPSADSSQSGETAIFNFNKEVPADAVLRVTVATPKALVAIPFSARDVVLP